MGAPAWREGVARALQRNRGSAAARFCQLATVRGDGRPACRTVVFRGFLGGPEDAEEASRLTFVTDARSEKVEELGRQPACELCWYLPGTREQFRWAPPRFNRRPATSPPLSSSLLPPPPFRDQGRVSFHFTATDRGHARTSGPGGAGFRGGWKWWARVRQQGKGRSGADSGRRRGGGCRGKPASSSCGPLPDSPGARTTASSLLPSQKRPAPQRRTSAFWCSRPTTWTTSA